MNDTYFGTGHREKMQNLFDIFPVGMMIFEKIKAHPCSDLKLRYMNKTASKILRKSHSKSEEEINKALRQFNKLKKFSTLNEVYLDMNDVSEENLYNRIFDDLDQSETEICERYISKEIMIYVKIKIHQEYKLVTIENFNDERIAIQNNIIKNIKTQYLLTLSHELNNPLNSLAHAVNEVISIKEETKEKKKFLNEMKINIGLIKFFIKNFIFSVKMSFDMNTVVKPEMEKMKEDCINLEYIFRKIKEKYSIFFQSKKIKVECNFNLMETIYVTYDYDNFKSMMKNIFMYLFYRIERNGGIKIELQFEKELKIMFKKNVNKNYGNYLYQRKKPKQTSHLDTTFINELDIESSVKTLKILNDIIKKFAILLGVRVQVIEEESPIYLILYLKYDIDEDLLNMGNDLAEEFTNRESKKRNINKLDRSISIILETVSDNNKSLIKKSRNLDTNKKYFTNSEQSLNASSDSWNLSWIGNSSIIKMNQDNIIAEEIREKNEERILSNNNKPKKLSWKSDDNRTEAKNLKHSATIKSEKENLANEIRKTMIVRSNFTFTYTTNESFTKEVDVKVDVVLDETIHNTKINEHNSTPGLNIKIQDKSEHLATSKLNNGCTIKINSNIDNTYNNCSKKIENNSKGSEHLLKKTSFNSSINKKLNTRSHLSSSNLKLPVKVISLALGLNTNELSRSNSNCSNKFDLINPIKTTRIISTSEKSPDILVVDDDNFNLNVIQSMLKKLNLSSDTCMNGLECLNKVKSKYEKGIEYKLILMDIMMPVMDGIEASTKIEELVKSKKLNSNIKIIIISAHNNQEIINRATKLSVVKEFLSKPVKRGDIQRIINNY